MDDIRPNVKALFFEAIDQRSPEELRCFLDRACAHDGRLRANLEQLLRAHRDAGNFLEGAPAAIDQPQLERPGHKSAPTSSWSRSAKGAWALSSWPSRPAPCSAAWP